MPATTTTTALPDCHACHGTGVDAAFGGSCDCLALLPAGARLAAARRTTPTTLADRFHTPGERLDGRSFGGSQPGSLATPAQIALLERLVAERIPVADSLDDAARSFCRAGLTTLRAIRAGRSIDRRAMSQIIDEVMQVRVPRATPTAATTRTNRYDAKCANCGATVAAETGALTSEDGKWVVRHVECPAATVVDRPEPTDTPDVAEGHYAVPSATGNNDLDFYRVDRPTEGRWAGRTFVKRIIGGHPDTPVRGAEARDALERIALDAEAAALLYGQTIGRCSICNHRLTRKYSRMVTGYGPDCADNNGLPFDHAAYAASDSVADES